MIPLDLGPQFWIRLVEISFLNLLLSGDNAVLIALAVRALPRHQRILGQVWGAAGAVVLRLVFVGIVSLLLTVPFLRLAGGAVLLWIAYELVQPDEGKEEAGRHGQSLWHAVWLILVADMTMSLDNVLAIAGAAHGNMMLVAIGIAMSVPIVIVGSGILAALMSRYPAIVWIGGGILGYVAGDMMLEDPWVEHRVGRWLKRSNTRSLWPWPPSSPRWAGGSRAVIAGGARRDGTRGSRVPGAPHRTRE